MNALMFVYGCMVGGAAGVLAMCVLFMAREVNDMQANEIGECEWCGRVDHHLVDGECPSCHAQVHELPRDYAPQPEARHESR